MPRITIKKGGVTVSEKRTIDFVEGGGITITAAVGTGHAATTIQFDVAPSGIDHGALAGLADDDHTQYANLSQAETFTLGPITIQTGGVGNVGLLITGAASQTAEIFQVKNSSLDTIARVTADNRLSLYGRSATVDPRVEVECVNTNANRSAQVRLTNSAGNFAQFFFTQDNYSGAAKSFHIDNEASGGKIIFQIAGVDKLVLDGSGNLQVVGHAELDGDLNHDGSNVGFYGTAPIAKQTGVAVTAAGIHAALVNLGLIAA